MVLQLLQGTDGIFPSKSFRNGTGSSKVSTHWAQPSVLVTKSTSTGATRMEQSCRGCWEELTLPKAGNNMELLGGLVMWI